MSSDQIDAAQERLQIPVPEMIFGENQVRITHLASNWSISFNALDALDLVDKTGDKMLQVAHSNVWHTARLKAGGFQGDVEGIVKPYDWTYTTDYRGTIGAQGKYEVEENDDIQLPLELLKRPDPILFFDSLCLFEDELGDNGMVTLDIKIRVMPERIFVLSRVFVRLDEVIFRVRDTRVLIELDKRILIREYKEYEDTYQVVKNKVPAGAQDFGQFLRDSNWVVGHLKSGLRKTDAWMLYS